MKMFACSAALLMAALFTFGESASAKDAGGPRTLVSPPASFSPVSSLSEIVKVRLHRRGAMSARTGRYLDGRSLGYNAYALGKYVRPKDNSGKSSGTAVKQQGRHTEMKKTLYLETKEKR